MSPQLTALLPGLIMAAAGPVILLLIAVRRSHRAALGCLLLMGAAAVAALWPAASAAPVQVSFLLRIDTFALFFTGALVLATMAVAALAYDYFRSCDLSCEEFYALLALGCTGAVTLAASTHFVSLVLGLELLSVALYVLIGYHRSAPNAVEAAMKYLILASVSSAFLLLGLALLYFTFGTMEFDRIAPRLGEASGITAAAGVMLVLVGAGYKLALVPFHLWTPDVYEGASAPVSAFVAAIPKAAMLALLFRFLFQTGLGQAEAVATAIALVAGASMILGNILALQQANIKRLLAYSSIAHMGYAVVALLAAGDAALAGTVFYAVAYLATVLAAFGVVSALSSAGAEWAEVEDYRGLFWRKPAPAFLLAGAMLSLAGIPLTIGFIGKFLVLSAGIGSTLWTLSIILVLTSAVGLYYYLRVTIVLFTRSEHPADPVIPAVHPAEGIVLALLAAVILVLGVYPGPLISLVQSLAFLPR